MNPNRVQGKDVETEELNLRITADERIRRFEEEYNPLQYQLEGWSIWPLFRFSLFTELARARPKPGKAASRPDRFERLKAVVTDFFRLLKLHHSDVVVLTRSSNHSEQIGDRYKDIYFDELLEQLGSYYKIEDTVHQTYQERSRKAVIPRELTLNIFKFATALLIRVGGPGQIEEISIRLSADVKQGLGVDLPAPYLRAALRNFFWSRRLFRLVLRRIEPKSLLLTTAYSSSHALVAAAKELGVEVVEFQHGLVNRFHNGYSWSSSALPYKHQMPIPDKIFLYGRYWKDELAVRGFWREELKPVGSLRVDQYRKQKVRQPANSQRSFKILFTTQNLATDEIASFFSEFMDIAKDRTEVCLTIKLHPGEVGKTVYENYFTHDERVRILLNVEGPSTFELLLESDLHMSVFSTCHYEALALGIPTAVLPFSGYQMVGNLIDTGDAFLTRTPEELLELVQRLKAGKAETRTGEVFFKPGALVNMKQELRG